MLHTLYFNCCFIGKAGGFLALDWTDDLARTSYGLHQELAETLEADIGYRPVQSLAVAATGSRRSSSSKRRSSKLPGWLDGSVSGGQVSCTLQLNVCMTFGAAGHAGLKQG